MDLEVGRAAVQSNRNGPGASSVVSGLSHLAALVDLASEHTD